MRNHRGFTLIELLVSLVLLGIVTGSIYTLLNTTQRVSRAQAERTDLQSNIRTGAIIVPAELREINTVLGSGDATQNDVEIFNPTSIRYRAMRGLGFACQQPTAGEIRLARSTWFGYRDPMPLRDSVYVFIENNPDLSDDVWIQARVSAVATGNVCPGGVAGITLTISPAVLGLNSATPGAPVRTWEQMQLQLYAQGGEQWLGAESVSGGGGMQPMLGPLTADGFGLEYLNATGGTATAANQIKSIRVTIKGLTDQKIADGMNRGRPQNVRDSLITQVSLRNALR